MTPLMSNISNITWTNVLTTIAQRIGPLTAQQFEIHKESIQMSLNCVPYSPYVNTLINFDTVNGLVSNRRQTITWSSHDA